MRRFKGIVVQYLSHPEKYKGTGMESAGSWAAAEEKGAGEWLGLPLGDAKCDSGPE